MKYVIIVRVKINNPKAQNNGQFIDLFSTGPSSLWKANVCFNELQEKFAGDNYQVEKQTIITMITTGGFVMPVQQEEDEW